MNAPADRDRQFLGHPRGLGVIVFTIVITVFYVRRANREFDALAGQITQGALK